MNDVEAPRRKPQPSAEAIAALRESAAALDVEDLVDLCYATEPDELRVNIYLEALRGRAGEKAQVAACLLCFDLARRGDERKAQELQLLLPTLDALTARDDVGEAPAVRALTGQGEVIEGLWRDLVSHARQRDRRADADAIEIDIDDVGGFVEVDLFDADEFAELAVGLAEIELTLDLDDEVFLAFDEGLNKLIPPLPSNLFSAETADDLERLERIREHCQSFAGKLPIAAELLALTQLFVATHTRSHGLFLRRNKKRDRALADGLAALLALPAPPAEGIGWFIGGDLPGSDADAWPRMAEVLLELIRFTGRDVEHDPERHAPTLTADAWARGLADAFVDDATSAKIPPRLHDGGDRRRR